MSCQKELPSFQSLNCSKTSAQLVTGDITFSLQVAAALVIDSVQPELGTIVFLLQEEVTTSYFSDQELDGFNACLFHLVVTAII